MLSNFLSLRDLVLVLGLSLVLVSSRGYMIKRRSQLQKWNNFKILPTNWDVGYAQGAILSTNLDMAENRDRLFLEAW